MNFWLRNLNLQFNTLKDPLRFVLQETFNASRKDDNLNRSLCDAMWGSGNSFTAAKAAGLLNLLHIAHAIQTALQNSVSQPSLLDQAIEQSRVSLEESTEATDTLREDSNQSETKNDGSTPQAEKIGLRSTIDFKDSDANNTESEQRQVKPVVEASQPPDEPSEPIEPNEPHENSRSAPSQPQKPVSKEGSFQKGRKRWRT